MVIWTILLTAALFSIATGFVPKKIAGSCRSAVKSISFEEAVNEAKETLGDRTGSELTYKVAFVLREKEAKMEMEMEKAIAVKDKETEKLLALQRKDIENECVKAHYKKQLSAVVLR